MSIENKVIGKTFWDFMSEHIKIVFILFIIVVVVLLVLVFNNRTIKIAGVEIAKEKPVLENKNEPIKTDLSIVKNSNDLNIETEQIPIKKTSNKKFENNIVQPTNTNSGINSGIIGNNNTVNLNEKPLIFSESDKIKLIELISIEIVKTDSTCIIVSGLMNDNRSMKMADIIYPEFKPQMQL